MRTVVPLALGALLLTGCTSASSATTPAGCGLVPTGRVVGILGKTVDAEGVGSLAELRDDRSPLACRTTVPGHPERFVTIRAEYHPEQVPVPAKACASGWVYAGTPDKYAPACQETVEGHGRTQLIVRWQPYLMRVTIGRSDREWGGDPEVALAMSRVLAQRLGVEEARGDG